MVAHIHSRPIVPLGDEPKLSVLSVQRTCVHDGPGVRTTVFFRGCNMRCKWCHNPEAQQFQPRNRGTRLSDIMAAIRRDKEYYRETHGGVTLSGGDPLLQYRSGLVALLRALESEEIDVAIETAGEVPWRAFEAVIPFVDLFLFDLKAVAGDDLHLDLTGRPRVRVAENIHRIADAGANLRFRMCIVPGLNDGPENLTATAQLLTSIGHPSVELLRYYNVHEAKAERLGIAQPQLHISAPRSAQALERAVETLTSLGINVTSSASASPRRAPAFTERIRDLRREIRDSGYSVCLETALLKTEFHKRDRSREPLPVRRARLLDYVLSHKSITVYPHELLAGNFTAKRVGGNVWVELYGAAMAINLWKIDRQKPVAFHCSRTDKLAFYTKILPYWARRGLVTKAFRSPAALARFGASALAQRVGFNNNMAAIAHFIVNTKRLLELGTAGIAQEVRERQADQSAADEGFYDAVLIALAAVESFAARYAEHLCQLHRAEPDPGRRAELQAMEEVFRRVPRYPARTFHEALQSILLMQVALCTESFENAISLGRLDQVLRPYYEADVAAGRLDYDKARELVACFILKLDEVVLLNDGDSAFQLGKLFESLSPVLTVTVGGVDAAGNDATNDVTYMVLDVCELRPIGANMAARLHRGSPERYVRRLAEVYLNGSPMPALYNDEAYLPALVKRYPVKLDQARNYAIVGCVEPNATDDHFGNTDAANINVTLPFLQALTGDDRPLWGGRILDRVRARRRRRRVTGNAPSNLGMLMRRFEDRLTVVVRDVLADQQRIERALAENLPTPLASSLFPGCIASGRDAYRGGATLNSSGIQAVGVTDVADSLAAIDDVVFRRRLYSIEEVVEAIATDFHGERDVAIRQALLDAPKFGDDASAEAHIWVNWVLSAYVRALDSAPHESRHGLYSAGYYGLNVNRVYGHKTPALPSGRRAGEPLAHSICPHFGMQMVDLTSALNAVANVDFASYAPNGTTLTSTIDGALFPGEEGIANLAGVIRGFFRQGGMQFQPNLVSREILIDAYNNPGKYKDLVVRIAGYCGYFDNLSDELKREIIDRTYHSAKIGA